MKDTKKTKFCFNNRGLIDQIMPQDIHGVNLKTTELKQDKELY